MIAPFFVVEANGDLSVYRDFDSIAMDLEPTDVSNGEYRAFDAHGSELELSVVEDPERRERPWFLGRRSQHERVQVRDSEKYLPKAEWKRTLARGIEYHPRRPEALPTECADLVNLATELLGFSP